MIRLILQFVFLLLFSFVFNYSVQSSEYRDPTGRVLVVNRDKEERVKDIAVYDAMDEQFSQSRFVYDDEGHPTREEHDVLLNGVVIRTFSVIREYDSWGNMTELKEEGLGLSKAKQFYYLPNGSLEKIVKADQVTLSFLYDSLSRLEKLEASDGSISYCYFYDENNRVIRVEDLVQNRFQTRSYDSQGHLIDEDYGNGTHLQFAYDDHDQLIHLTLPDESKVHYFFDKEGVVSFKRSGNQKDSLNYQQHKDQLPSPFFAIPEVIYKPDGQIFSEPGYVYQNDSLFNRLYENDNEWKVNGLNQLIQTAEGEFIYDANGNIVEKRVKEGSYFYTYDALDRLILFKNPMGEVVRYSYDGFYRRIEKTISIGGEDLKQDRFFYDGVNEIGCLDSLGKIVELRILDSQKQHDIGAVLGIELKGVPYIPFLDEQGSVRALFSMGSQKVVERYDYNAFGIKTVFDGNGNEVETSLCGNPWSYFGKRLDNETGLIFFGRRYYDPLIGRWITPDPSHITDSPNGYAFVKNDPIGKLDPYGLFSIESLSQGFSTIWDYLKISAEAFVNHFKAKEDTSKGWGSHLEDIGKIFLGDYYYLMGFNPCKEEIGVHEGQIINEKVRITFVNGMLTSKRMFFQNIQMISSSHGDSKVAYLFCPTQGWFEDASRAMNVKMGYHTLGYRSKYPALLAKLWRGQIEELGGIDGGGLIIHYAHSLGGTETDRARDLLTPEEQKMIRVITLGSPTCVPSGGFESVQNHMSLNDGVPLFDPLGHIRNLFDRQSNLYFYGFFGLSGIPIIDHFLDGKTYGELMRQFGRQFLLDFA